MMTLDATLGALFDGIAVSTMLYDVTCAQAFLYFRNGLDDDNVIKVLVLFVWMMDTFQQALISHGAWYYLVSKCNGNPLNCGAAYWSILVQVVPDEICAVIVECFFVFKLRQFSKTRWVLILIIPSIMGFAFSMISIIQGLESPSFTADIRFRWAPTVFGSCHAVSDVIVAILMCCFLFQWGASSPSRSLIATMIKWTISTGVLSSILAVAYVITYNAMPNNLIYIGIYLIHPKVYVNSMLASMNGRKGLRDRSRKIYLT